MSRLELEYCAGLTRFIAGALEIGADDEENSAVEYQAAKRLIDKLNDDCPNGARITVEPL